MKRNIPTDEGGEVWATMGDVCTTTGDERRTGRTSGRNLSSFFASFLPHDTFSSFCCGGRGGVADFGGGVVFFGTGVLFRTGLCEVPEFNG